MHLKQTLLAVKSKASVEVKYSRKELGARVSSLLRLYEQHERQLEAQVKQTNQSFLSVSPISGAIKKRPYQPSWICARWLDALLTPCSDLCCQSLCDAEVSKPLWEWAGETALLLAEILRVRAPCGWQPSWISASRSKESLGCYSHGNSIPSRILPFVLQLTHVLGVVLVVRVVVRVVVRAPCAKDEAP